MNKKVILDYLFNGWEHCASIEEDAEFLSKEAKIPYEAAAEIVSEWLDSPNRLQIQMNKDGSQGEEQALEFAKNIIKRHT